MILKIISSFVGMYVIELININLIGHTNDE